MTLINCTTAEKAFGEIQRMLGNGYRLDLRYDAKVRTYLATYKRNGREITGAGDSWIAAICEAAQLKDLKGDEQAKAG